MAGPTGLLTHRGVALLDFSGPSAFDVREDRLNLRISKLIPEPAHIAFIGAPDQRFRSVFGYRKQLLVGVVPRVARGIMWWGWQFAIRAALAPILLAFQIGAMARRTNTVVDQLPLTNDVRVGRRPQPLRVRALRG